MLSASTLLLLPLSLLGFAFAIPADPVSVTASASPAATPTEYSDATAFKNAILNSTNAYRAQHNATSLSWNNSLATFADKWGAGCVFKHSGGPSGENLASGYPNATASVEAWGNERDHYDFSKGDFSEKTGHFTQLVWKSTTTVGCSRTNCAGKTGAGAAPGWFVVCEYYPPGNVIGEFKENVQKQVKTKSCPQGGVCGGAGRLGGEERVWWVLSLAVVVALVL